MIQHDRLSAWMARRIVSAVGTVCHHKYARLAQDFEKWHEAAPDMAYPRSFGEKILWRKLFDHDPRHTDLSDKLIAKGFVQNICPDLRIPKTLWVGNRPQDMPSEYLTGPYVIKTAHGWDMNHFSATTTTTTRAHFNRKFERWLKVRHGRVHHEWGYFDVAPKMFVEEMVAEEDGSPARKEFKVYVFGPMVSHVSYVVDRFTYKSGAQFDPDGRQLDVRRLDRPPPAELPHPGEVVAARRLAQRLGESFDFVRVDLNFNGNDFYFSEFTFYPDGGYSSVRDDALLARMSALFDLRRSWFLTRAQPWPLSLYARALRTLSARDAASGPAPADLPSPAVLKIPQTKAAVTFGIALKSRRAAKDWSIVLRQANATIGSIYNQSNGDFRVLVACTERPKLDRSIDERLEFLHCGFAPEEINYKTLLDDKTRRCLQIAERHGQYGGGYLMFVDADDLLSSRLVDYVARDGHPNGYIVRNGYMFRADTGRIAPIPFARTLSTGFDKYCATCAILNFSVDDCPLGPAGRKRYSAYMRGGHVTLAERFAELGRPLKTVPFPAVVYVKGTGENLSTEYGLQHRPERVEYHQRTTANLASNAIPRTAALDLEFNLPAATARE